MKILFTGAAGFIGSHLAERLLRDGHDVIAVDDLSVGLREHLPASLKLHEMDIRKPEIAELVAAEKPRAVFHLAAQVDVRRSVEDPIHDIQVNVEGTVRLALACGAAGVRRFIFASSGGAVYGDSVRIPTPEDDRTEPTSPYGCSKLAGERYLDTLQRKIAMELICLRYANVYGPRQSGRGEAGVVGIFMRHLLAGEDCTIYGDGKQTRDFVYVDDVVEANVRALETRTAGTYNIGTGVETTINDVHALLAWLSGSKKPANYEPAKPGEQLRSVLDCSRAQRVLAWSPHISIEEGLKLSLDHMRAVTAARPSAKPSA
jgi:UDP-glucose 4-epimerase